MRSHFLKKADYIMENLEIRKKCRIFASHGARHGVTVAALTAFLTAITTTSCMGYGPF
jgi:hypothetical protein